MSNENEHRSYRLDQFTLRFPDGWRDRIARDAEQNKRSMNSEILARLAASWGEDFNEEKGDKPRAVDFLEQMLACMLRIESAVAQNGSASKLVTQPEAQ